MTPSRNTEAVHPLFSGDALRLQQRACRLSRPGVPPNYLGSPNPWTGTVTPLAVGAADFVPQGGLLFVPFPNKEGNPSKER
jgi:hypothetical protein